MLRRRLGYDHSHLCQPNFTRLWLCHVLRMVRFPIERLDTAPSECLPRPSIVLFIAPPSGVVFLQILIGAMIYVGVCLGWAWGVITMKAALATRPQSDVNARYTELQQSALENTTNVEQALGQSTYAQIAVFEGFMLDSRVTTTYFCMLGLFIYLVVCSSSQPSLRVFQC